MKIDTLDMQFPHESRPQLLLAFGDGGDVQGTVSLKISGKLAEFSRLFVQPAFRRRNIGRELITRIVHMSQQAGCESLSCLVHVKNLDAIAFYRRLGFFVATTLDDGRYVMTLQLM